MTEPRRFHTIVVAMDFSPHALRALDLARQLASAAGPAHVILAHGYHFPIEIEALSGVRDNLMSELAGEAAKQLEQLLTELQDAGISSEYYAVQGRPDVGSVNRITGPGKNQGLGQNGYVGVAVLVGQIRKPGGGISGRFQLRPG